MAIVEGMFVITTSGQIQVNVHTAFTVGVSVAGATTTRDARWGVQTISKPTAIINSGEIAPILINPTLRFDVTNDRGFIPLNIVLWPPPKSGAFLIIESRTAQDDLVASFMWREVIVDPSADG